MLIPDNIHPEQSVYYNGSFVLKTLQSVKTTKIFDLYEQVKSIRNMSFPVFILCLDWLFLLNLVVYSDDGEIKLCI